MEKDNKPNKISLEIVWFKHYTDPDSPGFLSPTRATKLTYPNMRSYETIRTHGRDLRRKLQKKIAEWMEEEGLTEEKIKGKVIGLMDAKELKFFSHYDDDSGRFIIEEREVDALAIQTKATELAIKVKGLASPDHLVVETLEDRLEKLAQMNDKKE